MNKLSEAVKDKHISAAFRLTGLAIGHWAGPLNKYVKATLVLIAFLKLIKKHSTNTAN